MLKSSDRVVTLLFLLGICLSHLITSSALTILSHHSFSLEYPFDFVKFFIKSWLYSRSLSWEFYFFFFFYVFFPFVIPLTYVTYYGHNPELWQGKRRNKYGYAEFASPALIKKMGINFEEGIIFGIMQRNQWQKIFNPNGARKIIRSNQPLSTLIIAPTGTGKTAGFIIPTLKSINNSVVVFDIKGELHQKTSDARINLGHKILVLDVDGGMQFNPFAQNQLPKDLKRLKSYVKNISNLIFDGSLSSDNGLKKEMNYFTASAKELFNTLTLYLILQNEYATITQIKDLMLGDNNAKTIFLKISEKLKDQEQEQKDEIKKELFFQVRQGINQILQICDAKDQFLGVTGSLTTVLSAYDDMEIKSIIDCKNSSVVANDLRKEKITIYIQVKDIDLERLRPLIALFFETLISDVISNDAKSEDNQITFILDEFGNLGRVSKLIKATTISRSYKLNQIFILQDLAQISSIYSREERSILEANIAYKVILQQNNFDTAKRISDLIGSRTDTRISKSSKESKKSGEKDSFSTSQEAIPLVTPQDILNLNKDQCLIVVQGYAANVILADIAWWFKFNL